MKLNKRIKNHLYYLYYRYLIKTNRLIKSQRNNPLSIPVIIINFNQLFYLKQLVDFLIDRGFENIVIIDNKSTYPPLLEYYDAIKTSVTIEFMNDNYGHMVFFENKNLQEKYGKGYYVLTDADIVPNKDLPIDFMTALIHNLDKYFKRVIKVGFALQIDNIPDSFPLKQKVLKWEKQFWKSELEKSVYNAKIDTTFALYKPSYPILFNNINFYNGIRLAARYTCKHGGWYKDIENLTDEELFYQKTAGYSSSWNFNSKGEMFFNRNEV